MRFSKGLVVLGLISLAAVTPVPASAMEFNVKFDQTVADLPGPVPPYIGSGIFGFQGPGPTYDTNLTDGSYKFSDLTNVYLDFTFDPSPYSVDPLYFYYYYDNTNANVDFLYDPSQLNVVIYNSGTNFYFEGPSTSTYGNVGSLDLNMQAWYASYYPEFEVPIFLTFEPTNPTLPPGAPAPNAPYNRYGIYAYLAGTPVGGDPNLIYNGIYGTVPGPLPLAGAAATFAWSRRLRRRLKATRAVVAS